VLLDALKRGNWESFSELVSPVIGKQAALELQDLCREDFERLSHMHSTVSGVADWKTLIWPLEDRELRYVRGPLEQVSDLLKEFELSDRFPLAFKVKSAFEKWHNEFCSAWGRTAIKALGKIGARLGAPALKCVYGRISFEVISGLRNQVAKARLEEIDYLSNMDDRPSWRSCLRAALGMDEDCSTPKVPHLAEWLEVSGMLPDFLLGMQNGNALRLCEQIEKKAGFGAMQRRPKVFVSYSSKDDQQVKLVCEGIRALSHVDIFKDKERLKAGDVWKERLNAAIEACDVVMLFWSPNSAESKEVEGEWRYAIDKGKPICPIAVHPPPDAASIPEELRKYHFGSR
jgi:hypothetical protein